MVIAVTFEVVDEIAVAGPRAYQTRRGSLQKILTCGSAVDVKKYLKANQASIQSVSADMVPANLAVFPDERVKLTANALANFDKDRSGKAMP
eukprot:5835368-Pyramimonas_sp.AAC.1